MLLQLQRTNGLILLQQIAALREEEAKDDCWFMLPAEDDDSVDYTRFDVQIDGPVCSTHSRLYFFVQLFFYMINSYFSLSDPGVLPTFRERKTESVC